MEQSIEGPVAYRKRPVQIWAWQWNSADEAEAIVSWIDENEICGASYDPKLSGPSDPDGKDWGCLEIDTLEGTMTVAPYDFVICGVQGEFYPCKPDIFAAMYESVCIQ